MNALEQVTGWVVAGRFFPNEQAAREEKARLDFLDWAETKGGRRMRQFAAAVWAEFRVQVRTPVDGAKGGR